LDALPERMNPSGTAHTIDSMLKHIPGGVGAVIGGLFGHGPLGFVLGHSARLLGRELPDQGRLAILKVLGSEGPVNIPGFRAMLSATEALHKADTAIRNSVTEVFSPKATLGIVPSASSLAADRKKLDNQLKIAADDPEAILRSAAKDSHYLPEQSAATAAVLGRATQYLNSLRPDTTPSSPFGPKRVPSEVEKARYDRALNVAQQPLLVLQYIKDGFLTQQDITTISTIHPKLYESLKEKLMSEAIAMHEKGKIVPYRTLQSLSMFMGQPLVESLQPQAIAMNQMSAQPKAPQQSPQASSKPQALNKIPGMAATPGQAREQQKVSQ
jgi:hypothetical protein